jgi:hypothetical protein
MNAKKKIRTTEDVLKDQQRQADARRGNTAMVKKAANALAPDDNNPWIEVSAEIDKVIGAPMCKFTKQGEFSISDVDNIPDGTRCIAHANKISLGWQRWEDGKPVERRIGLVADRFVLRRGATSVTPTNSSGSCRTTVHAATLGSSR